MRRPSIGGRKARASNLAGAAPVQLAMGKVYKPDSARAHFELRTDPAEIIVFVQQLPNQEEHEARFFGAPFWAIPHEGDDVVLLLPPGDVGTFEPVCFPMAFFAGAVPAGLTLGDVVLVPRGAGKVRAGAGQGTVPVALAPAVEARLTALENMRVVCQAGGGMSSKPMLGSAAYEAADPLDGGPEPSAPLANPAHGQPGHVHANPEFDTIASPAGSGDAVAATKLEAI